MKSVLLFCACLIALPFSAAAQEPSGIDERAKGEWIHRESKVVFRAPAGWTPITPQRLRRDSQTTVMGIERMNDPRIVVNATYSPLDTRKFSDSVRDVASKLGDFGEEHALLVAVYGKSRVGDPVAKPVGAFTVYSIRIDAGPLPEDQSVGMLYLFEAGPLDKRWKVKIRASFPKANEESYIEMMHGILAAYSSEAR